MLLRSLSNYQIFLIWKVLVALPHRRAVRLSRFYGVQPCNITWPFINHSSQITASHHHASHQHTMNWCHQKKRGYCHQPEVPSKTSTQKQHYCTPTLPSHLVHEPSQTKILTQSLPSKNFRDQNLPENSNSWTVLPRDDHASFLWSGCEGVPRLLCCVLVRICLTTLRWPAAWCHCLGRAISCPKCTATVNHRQHCTITPSQP